MQLESRGMESDPMENGFKKFSAYTGSLASLETPVNCILLAPIGFLTYWAAIISWLREVFVRRVASHFTHASTVNA